MGLEKDRTKSGCADSGSLDVRDPVFRVILGINYTVRVVSEVLER